MTEQAAVHGNPDPAIPGAEPLRVDFYVIEDSAPAARLRLACRLAEKAYLLGQQVLVWHTEADELADFDELLWTFGDGSFVPHDMLSPASAGFAAPVVLSPGLAPPDTVPVVINLAAGLPGCLDRARRVVEIIDSDPARRQAGRARFRAYRDRGLEPVTHTLRAGQPEG